jgi:hypothetical protein
MGWAAVGLVLGALVTGCGGGDSSSGGDEGSTDAETDTNPEGGDGIGWPDVGGPDIFPDDGGGEGADAEGGADEGDADSSAEGDTEGADVTDTADDGGAGEGGDADAGNEGEPDVEEDAGGGPAINLPPGAPCGPGIGTCIAGASCIEVEPGSDESECYLDADPGEPCGPGAGQCKPGSKCGKPLGSNDTICLVEKAEGEDCGEAGSACAPGLICATSNDVGDFALVGTMSNIEAWGDLSGLGRIAVHGSEGTLWAVHPAGNAVVGYDLVTEAGLAKLTELSAALGALSAPGGVAGSDLAGAQGYWLAETAKNRVIAPANGEYAAFGGAGEEDGLFGPTSPSDVAVVLDEAGIPALFALDADKGLVYRFDTAAPYGFGEAFGASGTPLSNPSGVWGEDLFVYVADTGNSRVVVFGTNGDELLVLGGPAAADGALGAPADVACDTASGFCAVTEPAQGRVVIFGINDEYAFDVTPPAAAGDWAPTGVVFHQGLLYVSDANAGLVHALEASTKSICVSTLKPGEDCTDSIAPCSAGLQCLPSFPGAETKECKSVVAPGSPCGTPGTECPATHECVAGDASVGYAKTCLPRAAIGAPCGPGVAGCVDGAGCNWDSITHNNRLCFPDVPLNGVCNVYGVGDCALGSTCELQKLGGNVKVCKAMAKLGDLCGGAVASCQPGLSCAFDGTLWQKRCVEPQELGEDCGVGFGECAPGTTCNFVDNTQTDVACLADKGVGESCGAPGEGFCADDGSALCIPLTAGGGVNQCLEKTGEAGDDCGQAAQPPCQDGLTCIVDQLPATSLSCYPDGGEGDACGVAAGDCDAEAGFGCFITNPQGLTGDCRPIQPDYGVCGAGSNDQGACSLLEGACICDDPFQDPATCAPDQFRCIPQVELFEVCAINAIDSDALPYERGWVGLCPPNTLCGYGLEGPTPDFIQWVQFICKLPAGDGEACGLFHWCEDGFACFCNGAVCTGQEILQGDVGVCLPSQ